MRINRSITYACIIGSGLLAALSLVPLSPRSTPVVHAAMRKAPPQSPADAQQGGLPPNMDWADFLPAGEGQFQTGVFCGSCHSMKIVIDDRADTPGWTQIVQRMVSGHSAPIQPEDAAIISAYLGKTLNKSTPPLKLPIHINKASKDELSFLGLLPPESIQKIVDAQAKGLIKDYAALSAVVGDKNLDKYKGVLAFE